MDNISQSILPWSERALAGRVAMVTGGSRGLGRAIAFALGRAGAKVIITARRQPGLDATVADLRQAGIDAHAYANDIGQTTLVPMLVDAILAQHERIDVLVNNAGVTWGAQAEDYPREAWIKVVDVNLNGTWALTQGVAARSMIPRRTGSVIIVSSAAGLGGYMPKTVPTVAYNASKAALINLAKTLAGEWGEYGVRVNALLPGWFMTRMSRHTLEEMGDAVTHRIPMGRVGSEEDIVGPVLFLASEASRYVTGQALGVDGGISAAMI
jgi:NAD(P)-dependent dehydrogenase (short-subunit alcohol dehydrogenase family)